MNMWSLFAYENWDFVYSNLIKLKILLTMFRKGKQYFNITLRLYLNVD